MNNSSPDGIYNISNFLKYSKCGKKPVAFADYMSPLVLNNTKMLKQITHKSGVLLWIQLSYRIGLPEAFRINIHDRQPSCMPCACIYIPDITGIHRLVRIPLGCCCMPDKNLQKAVCGT